MERSYKVVLFVSALATATVLAFHASVSAQSAGYYLAFALVCFTILSSVWGAFYYFYSKKEGYYKEIVLACIGLTVFIFFMEYTFWDDDPPNPPLARVIAECITIGTFYAGLFFGVFVSFYFLVSKSWGLISRSLDQRKG